MEIILTKMVRVILLGLVGVGGVLSPWGSGTVWAQEDRGGEERMGPFLTRETEAGWLRRNRDKSAALTFTISKPWTGDSIPIDVIRRRAEEVARLSLPYRFGGSSPKDGGMDCSGAIQYLLTSLGYTAVPRTSYAQYEWVREKSRLKKAREISASNLRPGDLIFWGGTYDSGHKVSHVMLYMGQSPSGKLYMYGARGTRNRGVGGAGVDIFELREGRHKNLIGFGKLPRLH